MSVFLVTDAQKIDEHVVIPLCSLQRITKDESRECTGSQGEEEGSNIYH